MTLPSGFGVDVVPRRQTEDGLAAVRSAMRVLVSGQRFFLDRHAPLLTELQRRVTVLQRLDTGNLAAWWLQRAYNRLTRGTRFHDRLFAPDPNPAAFRIRSRLAGSAIARVRPAPDVVLHVFGSFAPCWRTCNLPYTLYLDYTMWQAVREYPPWAAFRGRHGASRWLGYERIAYRRARHLFVMSERVRRALVEGYGVSEAAITVVASGGNFEQPATDPKLLGSRRVLFDGSSFHRKGGDVLLEAFAIVRQTLPDAQLVVVGGRLPSVAPGVENPGPVDAATLRRLLAGADLVVAPARCDPFPGFVIEALNAGVPCLVSSASGVSDDIESARAGVVVRSEHAADYAAAMLALLPDRARLEELSEAGRRLVRDRLNWAHVAAAMIPGLRAAATAGG